MNKGLVAGIAIVVLLLLVLWMRPSSQESPAQLEERAATLERDSLATRDGRSGSSAGLGGEHSGDRRTALGNGRGSDSSRGGDADSRRGEAVALRERLAAAGARAAARGGTAGGSDAGSEVDGEMRDEPATEVGGERGVVQAKNAQNAPGRQGSQDSTTISEIGGEPVPEVAYNGGIDKSFDTQTQTQVQDVGKISGEAGTVSFWVKPGWGPDSQDDANFVQLGDSSLRFAKNVNYLRFEYFDKNGTEQGVGVNIGDWREGDWHQVAGTWNGKTYELFVDGKPGSQNTFPQPPDFQKDTRVLVGSNFGSNIPVAPGEITGLQVLNRPSSAGEIAQQHQTGQRPK
ncbi:MAG: LamG domain-containing protein [Deltaproteobacteria bacterium]|nr:LamG domain-containing protein [Deltaproteobacteria bacterium]